MTSLKTKNINQSEILVVDDTQANLQLLTDILTKQGYHVRPAINGVLALRSVAMKIPDLILLDVEMPDLNGYEVCRRLKLDEHSRGIPVIFISAHSETTEKVKGFEVGGVDYIIKPFEPEEVLARVGTHLRLQELTEHLEQQVRERTIELEMSNEQLQQEIAEQIKTEEKLLDKEKKIKSQMEEYQALSNVYYAQNEELSESLESLQNINTELEEAKERAQESDRLKSSFLANMSHEIRTPMNVIIGFSNLIIDNNMDGEIRKNFINEIIAKGYELLNLIENILDLSKIATHQLSFNYKDVSVNKLFNEIISSFKNNIENKGLKFNVIQSYEDDITIFSDYYRLKQVLSFLLDNAIKFTDVGSIELGYEIQNSDNENYIKFYVKDNGIGISKDRVDLIFERFTKIEDDKIKLYRGAGLGLTISKNIVELLKGELNVESELNKGSLFYFSIPVNTNFSNGKPAIKEQNESEYQWNDKTMLIAEDDESSFLFFKAILSDSKINIVYAVNGIDAVEKCKKMDIDIVLMDIKMPEMDGLEATRIIKKSKPYIPIIIQTAFAMENDEKLCFEAGCNAYISKPILKFKLLNVLNKFL